MDKLQSPVTNQESVERTQSTETEQLINVDKGFNKKSHPRPRLWTVTYVCTVALQCFFILGFAAGSTSPMLSELSDKQDGYSSLRKKRDQDLFNVSAMLYIARDFLCPSCSHDPSGYFVID